MMLANLCCCSAQEHTTTPLEFPILAGSMALLQRCKTPCLLQLLLAGLGEYTRKPPETKSSKLGVLLGPKKSMGIRKCNGSRCSEYFRDEMTKILRLSQFAWLAVVQPKLRILEELPRHVIPCFDGLALACKWKAACARTGRNS